MSQEISYFFFFVSQSKYLDLALGLQRATMKLEHAMIAYSPIRGCSVAYSKCTFCPCSGAQGNSFSPHPRPRSSPKPQASFRSTKCKVTGHLWHWGFYRYLEPALASNPTLTGGELETQTPCLSRHVQPAPTPIKERKETVAWCTS